MVKYKLIFYFFAIFIFKNGFCFQEASSISNDSLIKLDYKLLFDNYKNNIDLNVEMAKKYAKAILFKTKIENDNAKIARAYVFLALCEDDDIEKKIIYYDSAIAYGNQSDHKYYPASIHVNKGMVYDVNGLFNKALDSYLIGLNSAKNKNDTVYEYIIYHNIALLKRKLGKYDEAKILLKKCLDYRESKLKKNEKRPISYFTSLAELVRSYRENKEMDSALIYNRKGYQLSEDMHIQFLFVFNKGILKYHQKKYDASILDLENSLKSFSLSESRFYYDNYDLIEAYFFLAKSYAGINKEKQSIENYKKIDSLIESSNYVISKIRPAYISLINYYKERNQYIEQSYYTDKLITYDSILDYRFKNLNTKLIKDYDTPILLSEKEKRIADLTSTNTKSNYGLLISLITIIVVLFFLILNYRKRKQYQVRFENVINAKTVENEKNLHVSKNISEPLSIDIAEDVVNMILKKIDKFEKNKGFIEINITSNLLAKKMNTNSKYLTKVIKFYRGKSFSPYINDLRIDYIIERLKDDKKIRNYTIKALAKEAGFHSTGVFTKCFYAKTGIYPSFFIKKLQIKDN